MVLTVTNSDANEITARDANIPSFLGLTLMDDRATPAGRWVTGSALSDIVFTGADITDPIYPTTRAFDRNPWTTTRPDGTESGNEFVGLVFHLNPGSDDEHTVDSLSFQVLNGSSLSAYTFRVDVASLADFSDAVNLTAIGGSAFNGAIVDVGLGGSQEDQVTGVEYIRFVLDAVATHNATPAQCGHAIAGKRRQMANQPRNQGFDEASFRSITRPFIPDSGAAIEYVLRRGQAIVSPEWQLDPNNSTGIDEVDQARKFFADIDFGTQHFIYVDEPVGIVRPSGPSPRSGAKFMRLEQPELLLPLQGPFDRLGRTPMSELPPFKVFEV